MIKEIDMKVKELIEQLKIFDGDLECWWEDVIEGNHSELESVYSSMNGSMVHYENGKTIEEEKIGPVLFFSPDKIIIKEK